MSRLLEPLKDRLRRLPLEFRGDLHDVELVQVSLDPDEARRALPDPLRPRLVGGRALVSIVNVDLRDMRPTVAPRAAAFRYRHVAFRMLVDDAEYCEDGRAHGLFFAGSFTDRPSIAWGGDWLTHYRLSLAEVRSGAEGLVVSCAGRELRYARSGEARLRGGAFADWAQAREIVGSLDRAYAADSGGALWVTRILRPDWPLEPLGVEDLRDGFFESARLECAFRIAAPIPYRWLPPRRVEGAGPPPGR